MIKEKILKKLEKLEHGFLEITLPDNSKIFFGKNKEEVNANIKINNLDLIELVISKGDIGFGEAYINEMFETSDLANLLEFFSLNQKQIDDLFYGKRFLSFLFSIKNFLRKNNIKGSKKNISVHYDLGNSFYEKWLDKTMTYSSGIFEENETLEESQVKKYQRIISQLNQTKKRVLEIGCGWGGFINEASKNGFEVLGLTLSKEQLAYTQNLITSQKLNSLAVFKDYRHEIGKFDNIVSIEMFEAVGKEYWNSYFEKIKSCLKKDGKAVIQTITIDDLAYQKYQKTSDYIREYIFPGGFLPTKTIFENLASKNGLKTIDKFEFGNSYNRTLEIWLMNFDKVKNEILELGFDEKFIRKWRFYLAYCMAGFRSKRVSVVQFTLKHDD